MEVMKVIITINIKDLKGLKKEIIVIEENLP